MPDVKPGDAVSWLYNDFPVYWTKSEIRYSGIAIKYMQLSKKTTLRLIHPFFTFLQRLFAVSTPSISRFKEMHLRRACEYRLWFCICSRILITLISLTFTELLPISLVTTLKRHLKIGLNQAMSATLSN